MKDGKVKKAKALLGGNLPSRALLKAEAPSPRAPQPWAVLLPRVTPSPSGTSNPPFPSSELSVCSIHDCLLFTGHMVECVPSA